MGHPIIRARLIIALAILQSNYMLHYFVSNHFNSFQLRMLWCCIVGVLVGIVSFQASRVIVSEKGQSEDELHIHQSKSLRQLHGDLTTAVVTKNATNVVLVTSDILDMLSQYPNDKDTVLLRSKVQEVHETHAQGLVFEFSKTCEISTPAKIKKIAIVTTVTTDEYVRGAIALMESIQQNADAQFHDLVVMVVPWSETRQSGVSDSGITWLRAVGWELRLLGAEDILQCPCTPAIPRFATTCAKLNIWGLTQYDAVLHIDADTIVLKPLQSIIDRASIVSFAAVSSPDYPTSPLFQSASLLIRPSKQIDWLLHHLPTAPSFDLSHDMAIVNFLFGSAWGRTAASRLSYPTHVAQTAESSTLVPRLPSGAVNLDKITMFDFAGPQAFKPWRLIEQMSRGATQQCQMSKFVLDPNTHLKIVGKSLQHHFHTRNQWVVLFKQACARVGSVLGNVPPALLPLEPV
eukprot:c13619_g1_i1.p1 GENE.c13619_g1_i1~~c13619_g1_i1.p1  ORF type:complete len:461 (+),score=111.35 c13619_g1_i1:3-1385(+)